MARPLPKDLEDRIAGVARRSEIRSVGVTGFILGSAVGFGLGASFFSAAAAEWSGALLFAIGAGTVAALWFFAGRRKKGSGG